MVYFYGRTMDRQACTGDVMLSQQAGLEAERAKRYLLVLRKMGPLTGPAEVVDFNERLMQLDVACRAARTGPGIIFRVEELTGPLPDHQKILRAWRNPREPGTPRLNWTGTKS